jgi:hypothetical protein
MLGLIVAIADLGAGPRYWGLFSDVPLGDKVCHCVLMFAFCLLANLALGGRGVFGTRRVLLGTVIVTALVVGEEITQRWIPGRSFDLLDLTADLLEITAADLLARKLPAGHRGDVLARETAT